MENNAKITVQDLYKSFGNNHVLKGVNLEVKAGSSAVILGGSGTGKSVLIKSIIGLLTPDSGVISYDGQDVSQFNNQERMAMLAKCGFLFQGGALFDSLNIEDNITFFASKLQKLTKKDKRELAISKLRSVGLTEKVVNQFPAELSGGMQKRVSLARSICTDPEVIFFDEPTTGLDPIMANVINDLIVKVREELGATTITITHDMNSALHIATDLAMIYQGEIIWTGSPSSLKKTDNQYVRQFVDGLTTGPIAV